MKKKLWLAMGLAVMLCGCSHADPEPEAPAFEVDAEPADMSAYRWLEGETADFQEKAAPGFFTTGILIVRSASGPCRS